MDPETINDDDLIRGMLDADPALAMIARRVYDGRHSADAKQAEPEHCEHCFEGSPRCQPR